jgi:hypothetical protein
MESSNKSLAAELAILTLDFVKKALEQNVAPDITETSQILRACLRHDILVGTTTGTEIIGEFASAFPHLSLFSLLRVRALLNSGKRLEAHKVAEMMSEAPPEVIFAQAEEAAAVIMK